MKTYVLRTKFKAGRDYRMVNGKLIMDRCGFLIQHTNVFDRMFTFYNNPIHDTNLGQVEVTAPLELRSFVTDFDPKKDSDTLIISFKLTSWYDIRLRHATTLHIMIMNQKTGESASFSRPFKLFKPQSLNRTIHTAKLAIPKEVKQGITRVYDVMHRACLDDASIHAIFTFT